MEDAKKSQCLDKLTSSLTSGIDFFLSLISGIASIPLKNGLSLKMETCIIRQVAKKHKNANYEPSSREEAFKNIRAARPWTRLQEKTLSGRITIDKKENKPRSDVK